MHNIDKRKKEILSILQKYKEITMPDIASILNVTTRTIRHDIQYLKSENHNIVTRRGHTGGVSLIEKDGE